jgi:hypothetical protein
MMLCCGLRCPDTQPRRNADRGVIPTKMPLPIVVPKPVAGLRVMSAVAKAVLSAAKRHAGACVRPLLLEPNMSHPEVKE